MKNARSSSIYYSAFSFIEELDFIPKTGQKSIAKNYEIKHTGPAL